MILFGSPFQAIFFLEKYINIISTGKKWIGTNFSALRISITSHLFDFHLIQKYVHSSNKLFEVLSPQVQVHFHSFFAQCVSIGFLQISISPNDTIFSSTWECTHWNCFVHFCNSFRHIYREEYFPSLPPFPLRSKPHKLIGDSNLSSQLFGNFKNLSFSKFSS